MPQKLTPWQRPHVSMASFVRSHRLQRTMPCSAVCSFPRQKPIPPEDWHPFLPHSRQQLFSESSVVDPCPVTRPHDPVRLGRMRARRTIAVRALLLALCATTPAQLSAATKNVVCEQQSDCTVPG